MVNVDFSQMDMMMGFAACLILCLIIFAFAIKYKLLSLGNYNKFNLNNPLEMRTSNEFKDVWLEIKDINERQRQLREKLPDKYVSKDDLIKIESRLSAIDNKIDDIVMLYKRT